MKPLTYGDVSRLCICLLAVLSMGGFRFQLAGINPSQNLDNFSASPLLYVVDILCLAWALWILMGNPVRSLGVARSSRLLLILPTLAILSTAVSIAPSQTLFESVKYASNFCIALAAIVAWNSRGETTFSEYLLRFIAVTSIMTVIISPQYGVHGAADFSQSTHAGSWRGVFGHRTNLAYCGAALFAISLHSVIYRRTLAAFTFLFVAFLVLAMTRSGGGYIVAGLSSVMIAFNYFSKNMGKNLKFSLGAIVSSMIISVIVLFFSGVEILSTVGEDVSLTGRVPMWQYMLASGDINYLTGDGYYAAFNLKFAAALQMAGFPVPNAQGAFMEALIAFGIVGPLLIILVIFNYITLSIKNYFSANRGSETALSFCLSSFLLLFAISAFGVESFVLEANKIAVCLLLVMGHDANRARYSARSEVVPPGETAWRLG